MEQALGVLLMMGFGKPMSDITKSAANPSVSYSSLSGIPLFSPALIMLVIIAYLGYHLLNRQDAARTRQKALNNTKSSSSSSSSRTPSSQPLSSSDIRSKGMPTSSSKRTGDPSPKQVSGAKSLDPRKDPSSSAFKKNYFLTMQGPGRPALVPFQDGLRPAPGKPEGSMWWDNIPDGKQG
jgi:hypothetical protein